MGSADFLKGKKLIVWNYMLNQYDTLSFGYPKYILNDDGTMEYVDIDMFPDEGAIQFIYAGGASVDDVNDDYSDIFVLQINDLQENYKYPGQSTNKYIARINLDMNDIRRGDVLLDSLSYYGIKQVIKTSDPIETIREKRTIMFTDELYTKDIILEIDAYYYGPFDTKKTDNDDEYRLEALPENRYQIGAFNQATMDPYIAEIGDRNERLITTFVSDLGGDMLSKASEKIDFASTAVLKNNLATLLSVKRPTTSLTEEQLREVKDIVIDAYQTKTNAFLTEYRMDKILEMIGSVEDINAFDEKLTQKICENRNLRERVIEYTINNRRDTIFDNPVVKQWVEGKLNENIEQHDVYSSEILDAKDKEIALLKQEVAEINALMSEKVETIQEDLTDELKASIDELKEEEAILIEQTKEARDDYNRWIKSKDEVERELKSLIEEYTSESKIIAKSANNCMMKDLLDMLAGKESGEVSYAFDTELIRHYENGQQIIDLLIEYLVDKAGRKFTYDEVVNFIVCIANGFITTFAGQPGTGKTSICTLIAKAFGLVNVEEPRFVSVAVERGWSSSRDYIGYYNPLSKQFEKSNAEMFNAIQTMDYEVRNDINEAPMFVLLDEANLSPIEHYWAGFNKLCDAGKYDDRSISLGGEYSWKISRGLRFLATINYDHTTEELSPRFLDRSWLIMLKSSTIDLEYEDEDLQNAETVVAMDDIEKYFTPAAEDVASDAIKGKLFNIQQVFIDNNLSVSPRNIKMVKNYCLVAQKYMRNVLAPLDFAVAQKILPLINGSGSEYDSLISSLEKEFEGSMPLSFDVIQKLKRNAENNFGDYQLF